MIINFSIYYPNAEFLIEIFYIYTYIYLLTNAFCGALKKYKHNYKLKTLNIHSSYSEIGSRILQKYI